MAQGTGPSPGGQLWSVTSSWVLISRNSCLLGAEKLGRWLDNERTTKAECHQAPTERQAEFQRVRLLIRGRKPPPGEACGLSTSRGAGFGPAGNAEGGWWVSRLQEHLEQRHGGKKMPFVFGGGSAGQCGWNTGCHRRAVVDRERSGAEGPISATQELVERGRGVDWCTQVFLPPPCLGPITLSQMATPPSIFVFLLAAVITEVRCISLSPCLVPSSPHHHLHTYALECQLRQGRFVSICPRLHSQCLEQCLAQSRQIFAGQVNVFVGACPRPSERLP